MQASLCVRKGLRRGTLFPVYEAAVTLIGSAPSNHIILREPGVSASHCIIVPDPASGSFQLIDARSKSGLYVKSRPFVSGPITFGDVISIGPFELELVPAQHGIARPSPLRPTGRGPGRFEFGRHGRRNGLPLPPGSATVIGRGEFAHIRIEHHLVSEYHCLLALDPADNGSMPFLIDLYSANRTYVNRQPIHRKHVLPGDLIMIGRTTFEVSKIEDAPPPAPEPVKKPRKAVLRKRPAAPAPVAPPPEAKPTAETARRPRPAEAPPVQLVIEPPLVPEIAPTSPVPTPPQAPQGQPAPQLVTAPPRKPEPVAPAPPPEEPSAPRRVEEPKATAQVPVAPELTPAPEAPVPPGAELPAEEDDGPPPGSPDLGSRSATARELAEKPGEYAKYYGFREDPFQHSADPKYFYHSQCHWEAFTALNRWIETGPPVAVLFGEHGSGKTFLVSCLARRLALISPWTVVVRLDSETAKRDNLILAAVLSAAERYGGLALKGQSPLEVWRALLAEVRLRHSLLIVLVDDAQDFSREHLQALAELVSDPAVRNAVRILLAGEEHLRDLAAAPPLSDHLATTCYLSPMAADDVVAYVTHRVNLALEEERPLFTPRALEMLATYSGGIPRLINNVADAALFYAFCIGKQQVDREIVTQAIDELIRAESRPRTP